MVCGVWCVVCGVWCVVCGVWCVCVCVCVSIHLFKMALRNAPARTLPYDRVLDGPASGVHGVADRAMFQGSKALMVKSTIGGVDGQIDHPSNVAEIHPTS